MPDSETCFFSLIFPKISVIQLCQLWGFFVQKTIMSFALKDHLARFKSITIRHLIQ